MKRIKLDPHSRPVKYFKARQTGLNKKDAALAVGYADGRHASVIEQTAQYKEAERRYADTLQKYISLDEIALAHADNITQDKDRGARNKAIEMAKDWIEPETKEKGDDDRMIVVLTKG